jgi:hypothetical protein
MAWARILGPDGWDYQLTTTDVVWAARMVVGEGAEDASAILWTMTQRFGGLQAWDTFTELLRAYSQPINPLWYRDGACCAPGATGCPTRNSAGSPACSERAFARRTRITNLAWDEIPAHVRRTVLQWARAELPNPVPQAVHFAAPRLVERNLSPTYQLVHRGRSWFAAQGRSLSWAPDHVTMAPGRPAMWPWVAGGLIALGVAGYVAWETTR